MYEFLIRGCRGTVPVCHVNFMEFGGTSTCYSLNTPEGLLIIDAGTGIKSVNPDTTASNIHLLFTHFHLDHVAGLPTFAPLYHKSKTITIMGDPKRSDDWRRTLHNFMAKPYWPVGIGETAAKLRMEDMEPNGMLRLGDAEVTWCQVPHPQGCLAFRINTPKYSTVIATDVEFPGGTIPDSFLKFCEKTTYLIFDAHYTPEEMSKFEGWGHSCWKTACRAAKGSSAEFLILTHHAPDRTDTEINRIVNEACREFPETSAAACGMSIEL